MPEAPTSVAVAERAGQPGSEIAQAVSPISGVSPELFKTLNQRHSVEFIKEQQAKYKTQEEFLADAEKEAEHIRFTLAKQAANATQTLSPKPLSVGEEVNGKVVDKDVLENARLWDTQRQEAAAKLLGKELIDKQKQELIEAHWESAGEKGLDEEHLAGVYNLTQGQISREARKLSSFTPEERRKLFEAGLVGILPPSEFTILDTNVKSQTYDNEPALKRIIEQVVAIGNANRGDEQFLSRTSARIEGLVDNGAIQDAALAQQVLADLEGLRITAEQPPAVATAPARPRSGFEQIFDRLENARRTGNRAVEQAEISNIRTLFSEIDALRKPNGEKIDFFRNVRASLVRLYYDSRVGVGQKEKLGIDEYRGQGTLERLVTLQQVLDPNIDIEDRTGRISQIVQESKIFTGENRTGYWNSVQIAAIENMPEVVAFKQKYRMNTLEEGIGGCIDYFNREGLAMIATLVNNRQAVLADNGIHDLWDTVVTNKMGRPLKDDEGIIRAKNFADVREIIEGARCQDPWIPNRGDYETWIQFVADDVEELREMAPYIIIKVARKLGTGEEQSAYQTLTSEKEKMDKGMAVYPFETEGQFRRAKSEITGDFNLQGDNIFSDRVRKGWDGFFHFSEFIASSCQDTEFQDHFADAVLLDEYGETMLALEEFSKDDGIFWRYGEKSVKTEKEAKIADLQRWQIRRRKEIENSLMSKKLRKMDDLLNLALDKQGNITGYGVPNHPAFQRLKVKYDQLDAVDIAENNGHILDADKNPTTETRWVEYCQKAMSWQQKGEFGDPREKARVTFQHPLARVLRPAGYKDAQGNVTAIDELYVMFEDDPRINTDNAYKRAKRRRIKNTLDKAEKVSRVFMVDSMSALAWFKFNKDLDTANGDTRTIKMKDRVDEINKYLTESGLPEIKVNANGDPTEAIPYKTLYRVMMEACLRTDADKNPQSAENRRFKFHYLLTKMGFDLDLPTYAAWNLGAHDTARPAFMLDGVEKDAGLKAALERLKPGLDEKNIGAKWAEEERRMGLLMQLVIRQMFPTYFNYPGHDTKGAGVKDIRNVLDPIYGISKGTSWINDLTPYLLMGEQDPAKDYGASRSPVRQWLGLVKGGDEVIFRQTGHAGIIEGPRDMEAWANRFKQIVAQYENMTKGSKEGGPGILKAGPFSGMFLWRDFDLSLEGKIVEQVEPNYAIDNPDDFINAITESAYKSGIELAGRTAAPLATFMKQSVESTFGRNPESAKFLNTLLWYAVSKWMDQSPEYRAKPGYAIDGNLHTARYFINQYLQEEEGLIYSDQEWDEIMLGYVTTSDNDFKDRRFERHVVRYDVQAGIPDQTVEYELDIFKNRTGKSKLVKGKVVEGLIDSFPRELRDEIIKGEDGKLSGTLPGIDKTVKNYWLPFGVNSRYPEVFASYYREEKAQKEYGGVLNTLKPRKSITRQ